MGGQFEKAVQIQREYYSQKAGEYNDAHVREKGEHQFALALMLGVLDYLEIESVLDVGSGTGRALKAVKALRPQTRALGIEPVAALREVGYEAGLGRDELIDGDATRMPFADGEFDLVCEFGVLHHIPKPERAVAEMIRVAKKAVFISDSNNFGQGSFPTRTVKQILNALGLWKAFDYVKTGGKGYTISEGDGLAYSFSVYNHHGQLKKYCKTVHAINSFGSGINHYRTSGHVLLLGVKS